MKRTVLLLTLMVFPPLSAMPAHAGEFRVVYGASLLGLPVGTLEIGSVIDGGSYRMQATGKLSGLAGLFSTGKGGAKASGALKSGSIVRSQFEALVRLGSSRKAVRIDTVSGNVSALEVQPPMDDRPGRVPVQPEHKLGIVDPLSAVLMPMRAATLSPADCNRTIPVFDGGSRLNLVMTYAGMKQADIGGYKGPVAICNVRYVPLAGHRPERRVIRYMMENRDISAWLAPVAGSPFVAPLRVSAKTIAGTAILEAETWSVGPGR